MVPKPAPLRVHRPADRRRILRGFRQGAVLWLPRRRLCGRSLCGGGPRRNSADGAAGGHARPGAGRLGPALSKGAAGRFHLALWLCARHDRRGRAGVCVRRSACAGGRDPRCAVPAAQCDGAALPERTAPGRGGARGDGLPRADDRTGDGGHIDPDQLCRALAGAARQCDLPADPAQAARRGRAGRACGTTVPVRTERVRGRVARSGGLCGTAGRTGNGITRPARRTTRPHASPVSRPKQTAAYLVAGSSATGT